LCCLYSSLSPNSTSPFSSLFFLTIPRPPTSPLFPYTTLFRSGVIMQAFSSRPSRLSAHVRSGRARLSAGRGNGLVRNGGAASIRSEEHTSELQSRENLVCRLLLEKKNIPTAPDKDVHSTFILP